MNKDSRITIGIALVYFVSGLSNLLGSNRAFVPLVFIDSFLLALLSLVFVILPPYEREKKNNNDGDDTLDSHLDRIHPVITDTSRQPQLIFLLFAAYFSILGCLNTGIIQNNSMDIANQLLLLVLCTGLYLYSIVKTPVSRWQMLLPGLFFILTFIMGYLHIPALYITGTAVVSGLWQISLLSRPSIAASLTVTVRRFYLLMVLTIFFDAVYQAFIHLNFPQETIG